MIGKALLHVMAQGPFQFSERRRRRDLVVHRRLGSVYLTAVLVGGLPSQFGFALLAVLWLYTGVRGTVSIARGDPEGHRRWMVRNFALTFAAVTLRIYLPASMAAGLDFTRAYTAIAWLCWVPNLVVAEWCGIRRRGQGPARGSMAAADQPGRARASPTRRRRREHAQAPGRGEDLVHPWNASGLEGFPHVVHQDDAIARELGPHR